MGLVTSSQSARIEISVREGREGTVRSAVQHPRLGEQPVESDRLERIVLARRRSPAGIRHHKVLIATVFLDDRCKPIVEHGEHDQAIWYWTAEEGGTLVDRIQLANVVRNVVYEHAAKLPGQEHAIGKRDWDAMNRLGLDPSPPSPKLIGWGSGQITGEEREVEEDAIVLPASLMGAVGSAVLESGLSKPVKGLYREEKAMEGYGWFEDLERAVRAIVEVVANKGEQSRVLFEGNAGGRTWNGPAEQCDWSEGARVEELTLTIETHKGSRRIALLAFPAIESESAPAHTREGAEWQAANMCATPEARRQEIENVLVALYESEGRAHVRSAIAGHTGRIFAGRHNADEDRIASTVGRELRKMQGEAVNPGVYEVHWDGSRARVRKTQ